MSSRRAIAVVTGAVTLLAGLLPAAAASAAPARPGAAKPAAVTAGSAQLPGLVSKTPVPYTPDIFAGPSCGAACKVSTVYSTVVVNGEVVVAGVFGQVCTPAATGYAQCPSTVPADYIFAFNPQTGAIDPDFNPTFNEPIYSLAAGPNDTVYVGGAFSSVDGVTHHGLAQLYVTPGQSTDGTQVSRFNGRTSGSVVNSLAYSGSALYVGGDYGEIDGKKAGLARLNATTGAYDPTFAMQIGDQAVGPLQVKTMSLNPAGTQLVIAGTFLTVNGQSDPRLALIDTGGALGAAATLDSYAVPLLSNNCSAQHNYINGVDFSPDGSYFVIADTGYESGSSQGLCDAIARFDVNASGFDVAPAWVNYTGGDSFRSVVVAGSVVYAGGHQRWLNNECGNNTVCAANAVLVNGIGAIDANTGLALPWWHPETGRGRGVQSLTTYPAGTFPGSDGGLLLGTDVDSIAGATHDELAMFPLTSTATPRPGGPILNGMFSQGFLNGLDETSNGTPPMCIDDQSDGSSPGSVVDLATCDNSSEQNWTIESNGTIEVNGLCLDTQGGATSPGTPLVLNTCDTAASQIWTQSTGDTVLNQASSLCLDDPGSSTTSGTQLDIDTCNGETGQSWPLPVAPAPPTTAPVGPVYVGEVQSNDAVPCMADYQSSVTQGAKVVISGCRGYPAQTWTLESDGTIQFKGLCLDTAGGFNPGVVLNTCTGGSSQVWQVGSNYSLVNQASRMCLTDPSLTNNTQLSIQWCNGGSSQQWRLPAN